MAGQDTAREELIRLYTPFVLKCVSEHLGKRVAIGEDDEVSVGLMAFNEAIDAFRPGRGSFLSFADLVIKRRLTDYYRREARREKSLYLEDLPEEPAVALALDEELARREEISAYCRELAYYHITLDELVHASKNKTARQNARVCAELLAAEPALQKILLERRELPIKQLTLRSGLSRKTLERHRKYIIALALIRLGDFPELKGFLKEGGK